MLKHELWLADGTVLTSGPGQDAAIRSVSLTEQVGDETDLGPGAACAACAEIELWLPRNGIQVQAGEEMTLFRLDTGAGTRQAVGIFRAEQPVKTSANVCRVTAYDRMTLLDKDLSPWLAAVQQDFPMTLAALVRAVCGQCGVTLAEGMPEALPNAGYLVQPFSADGLTGRQLIRWAAQAACRFARMTPDGRLDFRWYTETDEETAVGPAAGRQPMPLRLAGQLLRTADGAIWRMSFRMVPYLQGTLQYESYETAPLDKVQIRQSDSDVGVLYPPDAAGENALVLQGNLLLTAQDPETLRPVAQTLFEQMQTLCYTPLSVRIPATMGFLPEPGSVFSLWDAYGLRHRVCLMQRTLAGQAAVLTATGNPRRDGTAAVNRRSYTDLQGKMLEIRTGIDGLDVKASRLEGDYTQLQQNVDGLDLVVVKKGEVRTQFAADAESVTIDSGLIAFTANTLTVDSDHFHLTPEGDVTASGIFSSESGTLRSSVRNGGFFSYANDQLCAAIYGYSSGGQDMGAMRCYGRTAGGTRKEFAVIRAQSDGGAFALTDANGNQNVQITGGILIAKGLGITGEKNRLVATSYGTVKFHALESPQPNFQDFGSGTCGEDGLCVLVPDPRFAEAISPRRPPLWQVTPTAPGALWVENGVQAVVHGAPGQTFNWWVSAPQNGYEEQYADLWEGMVPDGTAPAVLREGEQQGGTMATTKQVTSISLLRTAEGLRVAYAYSEIDEAGQVIAANRRGSYLCLDADTQSFLTGLEETIRARLG